MKHFRIKHNTDSAAMMTVFLILAMCIFLTVVSCASAYKRLSERDAATYNNRTCMQYVATRFRSMENAKGVSVSDIDGIPALRIEENGGECATYIYCYGGYIRELYTTGDSSPSPGAGEKLIEVAEMDFELEDGIVKVSAVSTTGERLQSFLAVRGAAA